MRKGLLKKSGQINKLRYKRKYTPLKYDIFQKWSTMLFNTLRYANERNTNIANTSPESNIGTLILKKSEIIEKHDFCHFYVQFAL